MTSTMRIGWVWNGSNIDNIQTTNLSKIAVKVCKWCGEQASIRATTAVSKHMCTHRAHTRTPLISVQFDSFFFFFFFFHGIKVELGIMCSKTYNISRGYNWYTQAQVYIYLYSIHRYQAFCGTNKCHLILLYISRIMEKFW